MMPQNIKDMILQSLIQGRRKLKSTLWGIIFLHLNM